jgi:hypothetical protein
MRDFRSRVPAVLFWGILSIWYPRYCSCKSANFEGVYSWGTRGTVPVKLRSFLRVVREENEVMPAIRFKQVKPQTEIFGLF